MSKRKWRVMMTLEDELEATYSLTAKDMEAYIKDSLEESTHITVSRIEAVEVSQ